MSEPKVIIANPAEDIDFEVEAGEEVSQELVIINGKEVE